MSVMFGRGNVTLTVMWLSFRKLTHTRYLIFSSLSGFFVTTNRSAFQGLFIIILSLWISSTCMSISRLCLKGRRYGHSLIGYVSTMVLISCWIAYVHVNMSFSKRKISEYFFQIDNSDFFSSVLRWFFWKVFRNRGRRLLSARVSVCFGT